MRAAKGRNGGVHEAAAFLATEIAVRGRGGRARGVAASMIAALAALAPASPALGQDGTERIVRRAIPAPVRPPPFFRDALDRRTRSNDGRPGGAYWQNWTTYEIEARLDPEEARIEGSVTIRYENRSPYRMPTLMLHLHQNIHTEGAVRHEPQEVTGGMVLSSVTADSIPLAPGDPQQAPSYKVDGTVMTVRLPEPLGARDTTTLHITWESRVPANGVGRMGHVDRETYFVAYWFPKVAVFDDLRGWDAEPYLGNAEFYDGFGSYRVALTLPAGWTAMGTGTLENGNEVYTERTLDRLHEAAGSDERVVIASTEELAAGGVTEGGPGEWLTFRFAADSVRDFAWTTSRVQRWDATSAVVPDRDGDELDDRVLIHSFWKEDRAPLWADQWRYAKQSIEHHSTYTGFAYPWPHMISVEGGDIIQGGMEFPMLTLIGPYTGRDTQELFNVTSHELAHMWIPMVVGTNEKRYAWMDEGSTTFLENQSRMDLWPGVNHHRVEAQRYLTVAAAGVEQSMMRHGDWYEPGPGYGTASYAKPATLMVALRELVMDSDIWEDAYRAFISEWAYKHPTPWDFFNTFERFAERDLDWFWDAYYFQSWRMDHAVQRVETKTDGSIVIHVEDRGNAPFPATLRVHTTERGILEPKVPLDHWLAGNTSATVDLPASVGRVTRVELNPSGLAPDADRANDFWPRG